jgi:hypothetical protein
MMTDTQCGAPETALKKSQPLQKKTERAFVKLQASVLR